ncbi:phosphoribosylformimino-5-aminoimidazole carboxamide ribotide isomerase [Paenibacillus xylaniclasticus]|uniref:phosphoribosylformimino-5-aminoimidazole carboxamide ribotide isomerase n=1 Tax=Paenibacillus xylaniclasticus TaxID=588083 RepID=UPI000FD7CFA6|nr:MULTISPECIES: phosphoribosylformimino-5-aminoimidazole carboxamide ribotide isomerase [Paenibacillus]GFN30276.1 1-(5-phosphoribosyl)-5-((5-phosphoribosylamino) methylideneamino)imidazole-4- carboxamide isomerase [Paenibacillus curdlanolyticus]
MKFRPCIDMHQGKVKQIVGETLTSEQGAVVENFVSSHDSVYYAQLFKKDKLTGGHVIMLGGGNEEEAVRALQAYPGGLQIGGGINAGNARFYLEQGASHVIVTSYIFREGKLDQGNLDAIVAEVGKDKLVIDLSCKEKDGKWYVVTNQWKLFSDFEVNEANIRYLEQFCDEFLIHAVDVEGKQSGIQQSLVEALAQWVTIPCTYAGGARSMEDLELFKRLSGGKLDITVGSALDIYGGRLPYEQVVAYCAQ